MAMRFDAFSLNAIYLMIMAVTSGMVAVACLMRDDSLQTIGRLPTDFIRRLNAAGPSPLRLSTRRDPRAAEGAALE